MPLQLPPLPTFYFHGASPEALAGLTLALSSSPARVVVTGGLGGMGKTALAAAVAREGSIQAGFDEVLWVTIGRSGGRRELCSALKAVGLHMAQAQAQYGG